jgi:preprotein translocase subunit SecG
MTILDEFANEEIKQEKTRAIMSKIFACLSSLFFAASLAYAVFDLETKEEL